MIYLITSTWIGVSVKQKCEVAVSKYGEDCVEALIKTLEDESNGFRNRNDAIWALGQLGDRRALVTLEEYYTGEIPEREPYDGTISQYELKKAIKLVGGGFNATAWLWR